MKSYIVNVIGGIGHIAIVNKKKAEIYEISKEKSKKIEQIFKEIKKEKKNENNSNIL